MSIGELPKIVLDQATRRPADGQLVGIVEQAEIRFRAGPVNFQRVAYVIGIDEMERVWVTDRMEIPNDQVSGDKFQARLLYDYVGIGAIITYTVLERKAI